MSRVADAGPGRDAALLFTARFLRMFAYGLLAVVLALYLAALGFSEERIGLLFSLTLAGDIALSLLLTTRADRWGRRRTLVAGAGLMAVSGIVFLSGEAFPLLLIAATLGVISPTGSEVGPFLAVEQAALSQTFPASRRTGVFGAYNLVGALGTALGSLAGGGLAGILQDRGWDPVAAYRAVLGVYAILGVVMLPVFACAGPGIEWQAPGRGGGGGGGVRREAAGGVRVAAPGLHWSGLHRSRGVVLKLSSLFALDAFGGGFVLQSILAWWFHVRFGVDPAALGAIFFGANLLAAVSALAAARLAARIGLINTMVFTHLPSNVLLILLPFMPTASWAVAMLLLRFSISQMDVPTRQSYTMAVVAEDERAAAAGITGVARSLGASAAPVLVGLMMADPSLRAAPFLVAGSLKIAYDLLLYRSFIRLPPDVPEGRVGT